MCLPGDIKINRFIVRYSENRRVKSRNQRTHLCVRWQRYRRYRHISDLKRLDSHRGGFAVDLNSIKKDRVRYGGRTTLGINITLGIIPSAVLGITRVPKSIVSCNCGIRLPI